MGPRNLVLIGLMGAGKSQVGRRVAARLDRPFVDTDKLVEEEAGMSIAQIFSSGGERRFRELESAAVLRAAALTGHVVSVGGGAVLDARNVAVLSRTGVLLWLRADAATLAERLRPSITRGVRPLLGATVDEATTRLQALLAERHEAYVGAADSVLRTDGCSVEQAVVGVLEWISSQACLAPVGQAGS